MTSRTVAYLGNFSSPLTTESQLADGLVNVGASVVRVDTSLAARNPRRAQSLIRAARPHLVLYTRTHNATALRRDWTPFWRDCEERGAFTAGFHLDQFCAIPARRAWLARGGRRDAQFSVGTVFTADGGHGPVWAEYGIDHRWLPPAVAPSTLAAGPSREVPPVVFVGSSIRYHAEHPWRRSLLDGLRRRYGDRFGLFGYGSEHGTVRGEALSEVLRGAQVVVGDVFGGGSIARYWSDRVPETLARGAVLVHPRVDGLDTAFGGTVVEHDPLSLTSVYDAVDGLLDASVAFRAALGDAGRSAVRAGHLWHHRAQALLDEVGL